MRRSWFATVFMGALAMRRLAWKLTEAGLVASLRQYLMVKLVLFYIIPREIKKTEARLVMGLRAFRTVFMGALAIRRPTPTWDFIILNKGLIEPPRRGEARPAVFQNFSPICVPSQKERKK